MSRTSVYLIDPSSLFREGLKRLLDNSEFMVIGEAASPLQVTSSAAELLLADATAAGLTPEHLRHLRAAHPRAWIVILANHLDVLHLQMALHAGLNGYLSKDITSQALLQSLQLIKTGEIVFPSDLATLLIRSSEEATHGLLGRPSSTLSLRETQILRCLLEGLSNKQIAVTLNMPEVSVKIQLKGLLRKIQVSNRTQAAIWAINNGIVRQDNDQDSQAL